MSMSSIAFSSYEITLKDSLPRSEATHLAQVGVLERPPMHVLYLGVTTEASYFTTYCAVYEISLKSAFRNGADLAQALTSLRVDIKRIICMGQTRNMTAVSRETRKLVLMLIVSCRSLQRSQCDEGTDGSDERGP